MIKKYLKKLIHEVLREDSLKEIRIEPSLVMGVAGENLKPGDIVELRTGPFGNTFIYKCKSKA